MGLFGTGDAFAAVQDVADKQARLNRIKQLNHDVQSHARHLRQHGIVEPKELLPEYIDVNRLDALDYVQSLPFTPEMYKHLLDCSATWTRLIKESPYSRLELYRRNVNGASVAGVVWWIKPKLHEIGNAMFELQAIERDNPVRTVAELWRYPFLLPDENDDPMGDAKDEDEDVIQLRYV